MTHMGWRAVKPINQSINQSKTNIIFSLYVKSIHIYVNVIFYRISIKKT